MSKLLIPIHVDAKVIQGPTAVPSLDAPAFEQGAQLEPGIHLHWALPDALTRARSLEQDGHPSTAVFPAVPDLWLIVRFLPIAAQVQRPQVQPAPSIRGLRTLATEQPRITKLPTGTTAIKLPSVQPSAVSDSAVAINPSQIPTVFSARRDWKAWVLDSRTGVTTPLEQWQPPASRPSGRLTAVGELPEADAQGMPGWGRWDPAKGDLHVQTTSYYPSSRTRFGFHDALADVGAGAQLSYAVIGWYADRNHDPLYRSKDREALLDRWAIDCEQGGRSMVFTPAIAESIASHYSPPSIKQVASAIRAPKLRMRELETVAQRRMVLGQFAEKIGYRRPPQLELRGPDEIVCHGAVVQVPRTPAPASTDSVQWNVRLSSSIKRATAELVSKNQADVISVEALLQDLEAQARTIPGFLDVPAAMHALTFESSPGASRWYAEIHLRSKNSPSKFGTLQRAPAITRESLRKVDSMLAAQHKLIQGQPRLASNSGYPGFGSRLGTLIEKAEQGTSKPQPPSDEQIDAKLPAFAASVRAAFASASGQASAAGKPLHPRWVRIVDSRRDAPPSSLAGLHGSSSAGWWLDIDDDAHLRILLIASWNAQLDQPSAQRLYEKPGPRWYRPGAPQLVVEHVDRAYRHGFDGRYDSDGRLRCRLAGHTLVASNVAIPNHDPGKPVRGADLLARATLLGSNSGLPTPTRSLLEEVLLLDPSNARLLAENWLFHYKSANKPSLNEVRESFEACNLGWILKRQPDLAALTIDSIEAGLDFTGPEPSPIALAPWQDPWLPLFVDVRYEVIPADLVSQYQLGEIDLEISSTPYPVSGPAQQYSERALLTAALTKVAEGALITKFGIDKYGNPVPMGSAPVNPDTFVRTDVLSAALVRLDERLRAANHNQRSGRLRVVELAIVDSFGTRRSWTPPVNPVLNPGDPQAPPWLIGLTPRLPHWARIMARFMSAEHPGVEADYGESPVCGFLLPDHIEHALEVFDAAGQAIGQLVSDPPVRGNAGPRTLSIRFDPHPWLEHQGPALDAIANSHLRTIVAGIIAQTTEVPANAAAQQIFESGLTALLRLFDTVGGTVAWSGEHGDRNVRLFGKLVAVVRTKLWFETSGAERPPNAPQQHPKLRVQIGALTRPDDGVYGVFLPGAEPSASRFAPVEDEVLESAVINGLRDAVYGSVGVAKLVHPFIADPTVGESCFELSAGEQRELNVFVEVGASMYLTSGVLPRKKLTLDPWFYDPAVRHIEPTFAVGPVLAVPGLDGRPVPVLPHPDLAGHEEWWLERPDEGGSWEVQVLPQIPLPGAIPRTRVVLTEGYIRLEPARTDSE